jgi:hypothetical protein
MMKNLVINNENSSWNLTNSDAHLKFIHDNYLQIQEINASSPRRSGD